MEDGDEHSYVFWTTVAALCLCPHEKGAGVKLSVETIQVRTPGLNGGARGLRAGRFWLSLALTAVLLALSANSALAFETRSFTGVSFGPDGVAGTEAFTNLQSITVDQDTGDLYAYDAGGTGKVYKFDSAGEPVAFSGLSGSNAIEGIGGFVEPGAEQVAVAPPDSPGGTAGDIYVANPATVKVYSAAGLLLGTLGQQEPCGVAVDPAGHVFVGSFEGNGIREYVPTQNPPANTPAQTGSVPGLGLCNVGADGSGNVYATNYETGARTAKLEGLADTSPTFIQPGGQTINVDPSSGDLLIDRGRTVAQYDSSGTLVATFAESVTDSFGVAVNSAANEVYVGDGGNGKIELFGSPFVVPSVTAGPTTGVGRQSAILHATVDPSGLIVDECTFEYGTTEAYGSSKACEGSLPTDESDHPVTAALSGLTAVTQYFFRVVVNSANGSTSAMGSFQTRAQAPLVLGEPATLEVGLTDATVAAKINTGGVESTYHIEYGPDANYGSVTPETSAGTSEQTVEVGETLTGLSQATTYHWRIVAASEGETFTGPDLTFNTFAPSPAPQADCPNQQFRVGEGASLPDCRAYEQATPVNKHGSNSTTNVNLTEASAAGSRIDFGNAAGLPTTGGSSIAAPYLASRSGETWSTNGILPSVSPGESATTMGWDEEFRSVLSYAPTEGLFLADTENMTFEHVVSTTGQGFTASLGAFAEDPKHFVVEADANLAPGAVVGKPNVFDVDHGSASLASRIPPGNATSCDDDATPACEPAPDGAFVGPYSWLEDNLGSSGGGAGHRYYTQNTISKDGSKVFFTTAENGQIYVRENGTTTRLVSASQATSPDPNGSKPAAFMAATPDGKVVYFTSCERLTDDSTAVSTAADDCYEVEGSGKSEEYVQGSDLYAYDTATHKLSDLSVPDDTVMVGDPKGAQVVGMLGATSNGSYVYFVANGTLAPGANIGNCAKQASLGQQCNIYVYHDGTVSFVSRIGESRQDGDNWLPGFISEAKESRVADSGALLFSSVQNLTGYESVPNGPECNNNENDRCAQYYRFVPETGVLDCVSCSPANAAPTESPSLSRSNPGFFTERPTFSFLVRGISADGSQVFFDTRDKLVPADTNGMIDAYEWEALGVGSCQTEEVEGGCLYLLSTGKSDRDSYIGDISTSGQSAFIFTNQPLVPIDTDQITDVYDARVDGGLSSQYPPPEPPCSQRNERCPGPGTSPPEASTPGSSTFGGPGNEKASPHKPCKKKSKGKKSKSNKQCKQKKSKKKHHGKKKLHGKKKSSNGHGNAGGSK
jgi:hypothetical protein